jgi:fido (protein-threonine AMPylation protein)
MARRPRSTEPVETLGGVVVSYTEVEPLLQEAEWRGRRWAFEKARKSVALETPTDADVLELHREMFSSVFPWAGRPRTTEVGPGGIVHVPAHEVRSKLHAFAGDLRAWVEAKAPDPTLDEIAVIIADSHHRLQWIHPFQDTNGRTFRVFDEYLLWATFGFAAGLISSSKFIEHFPTEAHENEYFEGLAAADNYRPERLHRYYEERLRAAFGPVYTTHWSDGRKTCCVGIFETQEEAIRFAIQSSAADPIRTYRVLDGISSAPIAISMAGGLTDRDGNPIPEAAPVK